MPVDKELYERLMREHGEALRRATRRRNEDPALQKEAEALFESLPDLDAPGTMLAIMIPRRRKKATEADQ